jgi:hypothetical protein
MAAVPRPHMKGLRDTVVADVPPAAPSSPPASQSGSATPSAILPDPAMKAHRLLVFGKALLAIGQTADARVMLTASAKLGNLEAIGMIARRQQPEQPAAQQAPRGAADRAP